MPNLSATPAVDAAVAAARSLPGLVSNLDAIDPQLATQLESKPLVASRSPWGTLACYVVALLSARYGLALDNTTTALIAGGGVLLGSYLMRLVTKQAIGGLVSAPPASAAPPAAPANTP